MKSIYKYLFIFIIVTVGLGVSLWFEKEQKIEKYLEDKTIQAMMNYNSLYHEHKNLADVIFKTKIDTQEITSIFRKVASSSDAKTKALVRGDLYQKLEETYSILENYNLQQLHFHLPNNESFLRFHRVSKFGDDLSDVRKTIAYTNREKKGIFGFEEGRIFNGYRFVYPLFDKNIHIGSVEVSFSTVEFNKAYHIDFKTPIIFLIKKDVVDRSVFEDEKSNYKVSFLEDFYIQTNENTKYETFQISPQEKMKITQGEEFSLYNHNLKKIITFIPVKNPITNEVVATHIIYQQDQYILNKMYNFYIILIVFILMFLLLLIYIFRNNQKKKGLIFLNTELEKKIEEIILKEKEKELILFQREKLASMGEMVDAIAHQWLNPLGVVKMYAQQTELYLSLEQYKKDEIILFQNKILLQVNHLVETISEFRNFFRPNTSLCEIEIFSVIESVLKLMKDELIQNCIEVEVIGDTTLSIEIIPNEFKHVLINLFNNSKDAFNERDIKNRKITLHILKQDDSKILQIIDNAGGVPCETLDYLFQSNYTTKEEGKGTGIGLYMTKQIVEKIDGTIEVENVTFENQKGAMFVVKFGSVGTANQ